MEYWSVGVLGLVELDLSLPERSKPKPKNRPSSAFDSQHSIAPGLHHSLCFQANKPAPLGQDTYFDAISSSLTDYLSILKRSTVSGRGQIPGPVQGNQELCLLFT